MLMLSLTVTIKNWNEKPTIDIQEFEIKSKGTRWYILQMNRRVQIDSINKVKFKHKKGYFQYQMWHKCEDSRGIDIAIKIIKQQILDDIKRQYDRLTEVTNIVQYSEFQLVYKNSKKQIMI